jgi:hypothetical protein
MDFYISTGIFNFANRMENEDSVFMRIIRVRCVLPHVSKRERPYW